VIVADASALVVVLVGAPGRAVDVARSALAGASEVHAPDVVILEVIQALRGLVRARKTTLEDAERARRVVGELRLGVHPSAVIAERAWELRDRLSAYDAAYLAVAEVVAADVLVTADRGLASVGREVLGPERVTLLRD